MAAIRLPWANLIRLVPLALALGSLADYSRSWFPAYKGVASYSCDHSDIDSFISPDRDAYSRGSISKLLTETTTIISGISSMLLVALFAGATGGTPISKPIFNLIYGTTLDRNTIMVVGDSVPLRLMPDFTKAAKTEGLSVISAAKGGCSPLGVNQVTDPQNPTPSTCPSAISTQEETLESYRPGYVLWWSRYEIMDRYKENQLLSPSAEEFWQAQEEEFIKSANRLTADGAKLVIVLTERPGLGTLNRPETELNAPIIKYMMNHDEYRQRFNGIVKK